MAQKKITISIDVDADTIEFLEKLGDKLQLGGIEGILKQELEEALSNIRVWRERCWILEGKKEATTK